MKPVSCFFAGSCIGFKAYFPDPPCAVPAVLIGIILGPVSAKFLDAERWGSAVEGQQESITLVSPTAKMHKQLIKKNQEMPNIS